MSKKREIDQAYQRKKKGKTRERKPSWGGALLRVIRGLSYLRGSSGKEGITY